MIVNCGCSISSKTESGCRLWVGDDESVGSIVGFVKHTQHGRWSMSCFVAWGCRQPVPLLEPEDLGFHFDTSIHIQKSIRTNQPFLEGIGHLW